MLRLTCHHQPFADGSHQLEAFPSWRFRAPPVLHLEGPGAAFFNVLLDFSRAPRAVQREVVESLSPTARARFIGGAAWLQQGGFVKLENDFSETPRTGQPRLANQPRLVKLHVELTHRCNFACRACYLGPRLRRAADRSTAEGTTEQWLEVFDDAAELGCSFVTLTGGEPLLRPDAVDLARALGERGMLIEINTNASCVTDRLADQLRELPIAAVAVSLYGGESPATFAYTGNPSAHRAPLAGVRRLAERGIPVEVKFFATRDNLADFDQVREKLADFGVSARLIGYAIHGDLFTGTPADASIPSPELPPARVVQEGNLPCHPAIGGLAIEPDGRVRACPKLTVYFGNAFEDGLRNLWTGSAELERFRSFWVDYCGRHGYVAGADQGSICPAARVLEHADGLRAFRGEWRSFQDPAVRSTGGA